MSLNLLDEAVEVGAQCLESYEVELVDTPADSVMQEPVFLISENKQIFRPVVGAVSIAMVDMLASQQWPADLLLHDEAMFGARLAVDATNDVAATDGALPLFPDQAGRNGQPARRSSCTEAVHLAESCPSLLPEYPAVRAAITALYLAQFGEWRSLVNRLHLGDFFVQIVPAMPVRCAQFAALMPLPSAAFDDAFVHDSGLLVSGSVS